MRWHAYEGNGPVASSSDVTGDRALSWEVGHYQGIGGERGMRSGTASIMVGGQMRPA